jgi:hypothetical protein
MSTPRRPYFPGLVILVMALLVAACTPDAESSAEEPEAVAEAPAEETVPEAAPEDAEPAPPALDVPGIVIEPVTLADFSAYLAEPVEFVDDRLDPSQFSGRTAVVASNVAKLWPVETITSQEELAELPAGIDLPIGTLLDIGETIYEQGAPPPYDGLFKFEEEYNYFYPASYEGQTGIVFGADLAGRGRAASDNIDMAYYYTTWDRTDDPFTPFNGPYEYDQATQALLAEDKLVLERVDPDSYRLNADRPDDMLSLYIQDAAKRETTVFLTTDLVSHSFHLFFNNLLKDVEEDVFFPALVDLVDGFIAAVDELIAADSGEYPSYTEALERTLGYFQVAEALMAVAPTKDDQGWQVEYVPGPPIEKILESYGDEVRHAVELAYAASGFQEFDLFGYREDFSQYKPRGHYTESGILEAYFRSMMWFGRIHMHMSASTNETLTGQSTAEVTDTALPVALIINRIAAEQPALRPAWAALFDPITMLIGVSDDLSFYEMDEVMGLVPDEDFPAWVSDQANLDAFLAEAVPALPAPKISGNSVFFSPSEPGEDGERSAPRGYRLFGQRFTFDSFIHQKTSAPRMPGRLEVSGLDIMAGFGSQLADALLADWDNGYQSFPGLEGVINDFREFYLSQDDDFWGMSFYNRYLEMIKTMASFEQGAGLYFTESPIWGVKTLQSAHGTWAELRHDTILYVKQVYGEMAGGGDWEATYRTIPYPRPIHYVEPNYDFYVAVQKAARDLIDVMSSYDVLPEQYERALVQFMEITGRLADISLKELADEPISNEDNEFILSVFRNTAWLVANSAFGGMPSGSGDEDQYKMPIIADVYTNSDGGTVLEIGTGIPYRMHVALNDGIGGKRIATGYVFSYYEFYHPMSDRLTNEQWRARVYAGEDLTAEMPFWVRNYVR